MHVPELYILPESPQVSSGSLDVKYLSLGLPAEVQAYRDHLQREAPQRSMEILT